MSASIVNFNDFTNDFKDSQFSPKVQSIPQTTGTSIVQYTVPSLKFDLHQDYHPDAADVNNLPWEALHLLH